MRPVSAREAAMAAHPAGKGLMSDEVRQALMDDEACEVASSNAPRRAPRWADVVAPALIVTSLFGATFWVCVIADIGRWIG